MASKATKLEDMADDLYWAARLDNPLRKYEKMSSEEQNELLGQVRRGTVGFKLNAKDHQCSFDDGKIILSPADSSAIRNMMGILESREYIRGYEIHGNNGTSCVEMYKTEGYGYGNYSSGRTITIIFRDKQANEAKNKMIVENQPLIVHIAKKVRYCCNPKSFSLEDLVQEGQFAFERAIDMYNPRGAKFSTYVSWAIRRELERAVSRKDKLVNLSPPAAILVSSLEKYARERGVSFTEACKVKKQKITRFELKMLLRARAAMHISSLSSTYGESEQDFGSRLPSLEGLDENRGDYEFKMQKLCAYISKLPDEKQRTVILMRYLIGNAGLEEVGNVLGVCKERVRQIEAKAIRKLREYAECDRLT